jgi:hypothetical protein
VAVYEEEGPRTNALFFLAQILQLLQREYIFLEIKKIKPAPGKKRQRRMYFFVEQIKQALPLLLVGKSLLLRLRKEALATTSDTTCKGCAHHIGVLTRVQLRGIIWLINSQRPSSCLVVAAAILGTGKE